MPDVNSPARMRIIPWPRANMNNSNTANVRFFPIAAKAMIPARIGVEHGVPARAKVMPRRVGYIINDELLLDGIDFTITGISKSSISKSFNPITSNNEAIMRVKYPPRAEAKTLPVIAQIIPITLNTMAVPNIKKHN